MLVSCSCGFTVELDLPGITPDTSYTCKDCSEKKKQSSEELYPPQHIPSHRKWGSKKTREFLSRNGFERKVEKHLKNSGCSVFRNGWPDYLAVRDGKAVLVEVKHGQDTLSEDQIRMIEALRSLGLKVGVLSLNNPEWRGVLDKWITESGD